MMESAVHAAVPLRVGKKMRKRRELDALVGGAGARAGRLLSASSDEGEPWARRTTRRRRTRPFVRLAACLALCVCVVSAATVLWLFVDVRRQIVSLRSEMDRVSTSSDSVGDALQICHTAAKELRNNATNLSLRLEKLEKEHLELAKRVEKAVGDLAAVTGQLAAAPELRETPQRLDNLQRAVAELGSQINGFDGAINSARKQAVTAATGVEEVKTLVHQLEARTNETIANVSANSRRDDEIKQQLAAVNSTLQGTLDTLRTRIDEMNKPTNTVAPSTAAPAATSPTPAPTSAPSTPTLPPGPPAKPNVLQ
ncbi:translation initiation factor IF-2 isoform X1 [Pectinophora gossypiella]|uniref:translation initiation factor IF-2 isoform X1 n=1 Tax=Pectinophora gossypiella TaxID=13191 RepID=UPI00214E6916|nr:translation initiation factor IF-2 isoform X1 [Pectinophora gossypiella]